MLKSYKYRMYPNKSQCKLLAMSFGCVRFIWNKNVEVFNDRGEFKTSTEYRAKFPFLKDVSAAIIQQKEIDFKQFKAQFFSKKRKKHIGRPSFKSRKDKQSFRLPNQKFRVDGNKIRLEKIGWIKIVQDRTFGGKLMSATVTMDRIGDYFVSILVEEEQIKYKTTGKTVGVDVGIKQFVTTSDGEQVKMFADNQSKQKRFQKILARKKKGSIRKNKHRVKLAKVCRKNQRRKDWLIHNVTSYLVRNYDEIAIEDLNIAGMMKNHCLANSISKQSWAKFANQLEYKCKWHGRNLVKIDRWFPSSKMCSVCGKVNPDLKLSDRVYICDCGAPPIDRDLNAAINIKFVGVKATQQSGRGHKTDRNIISSAIPVELMSFL